MGVHGPKFGFLIFVESMKLIVHLIHSQIPKSKVLFMRKMPGDEWVTSLLKTSRL